MTRLNEYKLFKFLREQKEVSKIRTTLHPNGCVEFHVEEFLATPEGQETMRKVQEWWEKHKNDALED